MVKWAFSLICVTLLLGVASLAPSLQTNETAVVCTTVCHHVHQYDDKALDYCGCTRHGTLTVQTHDNTDKNVCDYLCSIQMGGSACDCSIPIVPGRK